MLYFGYYAHQGPEPTLPTRPRHELHPIDKAAFMQRWYDYHYRRSDYHPPLLTLPNQTLGLPPTKEELAAYDLPTNLGDSQVIYKATEERIQPPIAETFHCNIKRPKNIPEDTWTAWLPIVEDHLLYGDTPWSIPMYEYVADPQTYRTVETIRLAIARHWAMKVRYKPLQFDALTFNSQRYGHNLYAMLNWLLWDLEKTHIPRFRLKDIGLPAEWLTIFTDKWPEILEEDDYQWWNRPLDKEPTLLDPEDDD